MYAIVESDGHQFKVEEGQEVRIDYREQAAGETVNFDRVLAVRDDEGLKIGEPTLEGTSVTATILKTEQGPKLVVQKFRRRKNSQTKTGHRQLYTRVKIDKINLN